MSADPQLLQHVLDELKEVRKDVQKVAVDVAVVKTEMKTLKVKVAGFAAIIGSILPLAIKKVLGFDG